MPGHSGPATAASGHRAAASSHEELPRHKTRTYRRNRPNAPPRRRHRHDDHGSERDEGDVDESAVYPSQRTHSRVQGGPSSHRSSPAHGPSPPPHPAGTLERLRRRSRGADDDGGVSEERGTSRRTRTEGIAGGSAPTARGGVEAMLPSACPATCVLPLDAKLIELLYALSPTADDRSGKLRVIEEVRDALVRTGLDIQIYGSLCTGLVIPASDIDCVMMRSSDEQVAMSLSNGLSSALLNIDSAASSSVSQRVARSALSTGIRVAAERMRRHSSFTGVTCIAHAKVPIVKCRHRSENVKVDLSFEKDGCVSSNYLCELFCQPGNELARPLIVLVKALVNHCGLDDPSIGGLGSFPISLLVLWFLKDCVQTRFAPELQHSIAVLLVGFLKYYGSEFDFRRKGIDYKQQKLFSKAAANDLFIMNPIRPGTNCARAATLYATRVVPLFQRAAEALSPLLGSEVAAAALEQPLLQYFGRAMPWVRDWRDVSRGAAHNSHLPQNMWDQATNLYMGGVL